MRGIHTFRFVLKYLILGAVAAGLIALVVQDVFAKPMCDFPPAKIINSVARVQIKEHEGLTTGTAVYTSEGWLTAAHVIRNNFKLFLGKETGGKEAVNLIHNRVRNDDTDTAYFFSKYTPRHAILMYDGIPPRGTKVWSMGFALGRDLLITEGRVMGINPEKGWLVHTAPSISGMSGGPVISCDEELGEYYLVGTNSGIGKRPVNIAGLIIGDAVSIVSYASTVPQHLNHIKGHYAHCRHQPR